ncbi:hypothetical protein VTK73DRAFT_3523 [Phialemonium thermophilum]|uniref:Uncharacterized protein n=1 Tax=Phialemonium thermophilum TaxID=223376 RepID=A0ABR3XZK5_9PEZI
MFLQYDLASPNPFTRHSQLASFCLASSLSPSLLTRVILCCRNFLCRSLVSCHSFNQVDGQPLVMPWLSRSPSPPVSPRLSSYSTTAAQPPLTYVPPLIDGACGTVLRAQQPFWALLREDTSVMMRMMPRLCKALWAGFVSNQGTLSGMERVNLMVHIALACMEMYMLAATVPLWFTLPGVLFALWVAACSAVVLTASWMLNTKYPVAQCTAGSEGWMMGQDSEDEKWIVVEGMGFSSRRFCQKTLPTLSKLFSRTMTGVCMPSYGIPLDMISLLFQRCLPMPTRSSRIVYSQLRAALLDVSITRVVVLAHNTGSVPVSRAVALLCADIPTDRLAKLEIYTFGSAAGEFVLPTGEGKGNRDTTPGGTQQHAGAAMDGHGPASDHGRMSGPHVEHYAMAQDPLSQLGVLRSVQEDLQGRFCGGVFVIDAAITPQPAGNAPASPAMSSRQSSSSPSDNKSKNSATQHRKQKTTRYFTGLFIEDYMTALFPAQMAQDDTISYSLGALDGTMAIDRESVEKREFIAMASYTTAAAIARSGTTVTNKNSGEVNGHGLHGVNGLPGNSSNNKKRLSWTGLGATVVNGHLGKNGVRDGVLGLEMARKGCKDCDGRRGWEISWLARYVTPAQFVEMNGQSRR